MHVSIHARVCKAGWLVTCRAVSPPWGWINPGVLKAILWKTEETTRTSIYMILYVIILKMEGSISFCFTPCTYMNMGTCAKNIK